MKSLKRHFLKRFWFDFHKIIREDVKLLSHKVLKVSYRYLEPFRARVNIERRVNSINIIPFPGGVRVKREYICTATPTLLYWASCADLTCTIYACDC